MIVGVISASLYSWADRRDSPRCMAHRLLLSALALATVFALSSCVRVAAYERETHAKRSMQEPDEVETKLENHVNEYREGAIGGSGVGGGGCGCN